MRYLTGVDAEATRRYMSEAEIEARRSPCAKSKRGVIIVNNGDIVGRGFNGPPRGIECEPDVCMSVCSHYAVHAEQNAILDALTNGRPLQGATMYHIKVKEGAAKPSERPDCGQCSKISIQAGVAELVLWHPDGYAAYTTREFFDASMRLIKEGRGHK